jgi:hypothetical protein
MTGRSGWDAYWFGVHLLLLADRGLRCLSGLSGRSASEGAVGEGRGPAARVGAIGKGRAAAVRVGSVGDGGGEASLGWARGSRCEPDPETGWFYATFN